MSTVKFSEASCLRFAIASALGIGLTAPVNAQNASAPELSNVEVIIVTGSYIRGTPEDAALPVDVLTAQDLEAQGSPTIVQLVKTITASHASIGEGNRYNGGAGTASINLRGFGASRTLTLMNGRRLADSPLASFQGGGANLNFIPQAALGRVEILKDGAAATYGSDAIGGVVNFLTRTDLDGFELDGEHSFIDGSDGDYRANLVWGSRGESGNVLLSAGYRRRSRLDIHERDWAIAAYEDPGYGGWTGAANPGFYTGRIGTTAVPFRDNGCAELGGVLTNGAAGTPTSAPTAASVCRFQFANFNDLVNEEDHFQLFAEANARLSDAVEFHGEAAWARDEVPMQRLSPANLSTQFPTPISLGGTSGSTATPGALNFFVPYNVPSYHPGLTDLRTVCAPPLAATQCAGMAGGVDISQTAWRAIAFAGHPTNPDKADHQSVESTAFRVSMGLNGDLGGLLWDTAITYMNARAVTDTNDLLVSNIQLALNGFGSLAGGARCTTRDPALAGRNDLGCYFFNPFTNAVAVSAVNNQPNPYFRASVANDPHLVEWLYGNYVNEFTNQLFTFDAVLSGDSGINLPGGGVGWALGTQFRYNEDKNEYGALFDNEVNPCVDSVDDDTPVCGAPAGPLIFFGSNNDSEFSRDVYAVFGEVRAPLLESLDLSLAVRFEDYGGGIGSTTDPKVSLRWQALDWLALRGSAGTTFRAPGLAASDPGCATGVANLGGQYRAVETCGNPNLKPETADAFNVGVVLDIGNFTASLDYFLFKFEQELTIESASRLFASMFTPSRCDDPAYAALQARFAFAGGVCSAANVLRINVLNVNGPGTDTSGYDLRLEYSWPELFGGALAVGLEATYLEEFSRGAFTLSGAPSIVFAAPEERAGTHDLVSQFFSYPRTKANGSIAYNRGGTTVRLQTRYSEGTQAAFGTPTNRWVPDGAGGFVQQSIGKLDDYFQHDLIVRMTLPWQTVLTASVQNVLDEEPADAPSQYNYDYTNGNPLGRVYELAVKKRF